MKTNIIIGRFQTNQLTAGHFHLINEVEKKRPKATLVFFIGTTPFAYNSRNPLPPESVAKMLKSYFPNCIVKIMYDNPSDVEWSQQIDLEASRYQHPVLFGSRDSFIPRYHGKYKCVSINELPDISATERRKKIGKKVMNSHFFRAGIIHAVENRFPTAYATVDIAVLRQRSGDMLVPDMSSTNWTYTGTTELLLGRKPGRIKYVFPGGFVDPADSCLEAAAVRELHEEVPGIMTHAIKYVGSAKVDDFRYKGTKDGIITSLFVTYVMGGSIKAGDDLEEVKWFELANFDMNILSEHHHPLFEMLKKHLKL